MVSQANQLARYGGFHGVVRNDISGIGKPFFDNSAAFGSARVLLGVEFYPYSRWTLNSTLLHETGHQWGENSGVWDPLGGPTISSSTLDRKGHAPEGHTPLLTPGAVLYGAVLEGGRRVGEITTATTVLPSSHGPSYAIERTMPLITYNPLTLYRMGHLPATELPTYQVFANQGQFDEEASTIPEVGTAVEGDHFQVTADDIIAADGTRSGPIINQIRRAVIYVSRGGLVSKAEMDIVNYFAARIGAKEGVTSWDRYPSFFEATGGKAQMLTAITPKNAASIPGPRESYTPVGPNALVGMRLDSAIPGRITVGQVVTLNGALTLTDRSDYNSVCFKFHRYGAADQNEILQM